MAWRRWLAAPVVTAIAAGAVQTTAVNGTIQGRVEIPQEIAQPERRPTVSELGMPVAREPQDRRRSVVYLEAGPRAAFDTRREEPRVRMDQRNETFVPRVLAIMAGTTVDFPNSDRTYHNVFSLSKPKPFDLGRYAAGRSKSVRFDRPGIVRVFCDIHSHMSAFILVFGHRYFAVTEPDGRFRIENVPPGSYTVTVWNEKLPRESKSVRIPDEGGDVELNFTFDK
jgi:plastocyanin